MVVMVEMMAVELTGQPMVEVEVLQAMILVE